MCVLGGAPKAGEQPQKIFVVVSSRACTSRPITASHLPDMAADYTFRYEAAFAFVSTTITDFRRRVTVDATFLFAPHVLRRGHRIGRGVRCIGARVADGVASRDAVLLDAGDVLVVPSRGRALDRLRSRRRLRGDDHLSRSGG